MVWDGVLVYEIRDFQKLRGYRVAGILRLIFGFNP